MKTPIPRRFRSRPRRLLLGATSAALLLAACGSNANQGTDGASLYRNKGCASCHGQDGEGRVGPALVNLYGSTITVTDRDGNESELIADGEYLRESITDPNALRVPGYRTAMPAVELSDEQVDELVAYIESLSSVPPDVTAPSATNSTDTGSTDAGSTDAGSTDIGTGENDASEVGG